jgi:hypothetical protein
MYVHSIRHGSTDAREVPVENGGKSPEMKNFNDALRQVMQVSKSELKIMLDRDKADKLEKSKASRPKPKSRTLKDKTPAIYHR